MWYANKKTLKRLGLQIFEGKYLVVVLDFVAVANLMFPNNTRGRLYKTLNYILTTRFVVKW